MNKSTTSKAVLDTVEQSTQLVQQKPKRKRLFIGAAVLIIVIATAITIILVVQTSHNKAKENNSAFQIDHKYYSKALISGMVDFTLQKQRKTASRVDKTRIAKNIFSLYVTEAAAEKTGVIPNSAELQLAKAQIKLPKPTTSASQAYVDLAVFNSALQQSYYRYMTGDDQGYIFVFDFSQKIIPPPVQETPISGYGNQQRVGQDKNYARQQAQKYFTELKGNKISAINLVNTINSNSRLTFAEPSSYIDSSKGSIKAQILYPDIYKYVAEQSKAILSGIQTGKVETKINPKPSDYVDGYYYFVQLTKASPIISNPAAAVANQADKLGAVYYGI